MGDLTTKAAKGTAWMLAMRATVNLMGLGSMVVLARLLTPEDFGLVALAGSAYVFFSLLGQFGFDIPLIHLQNADRSYYDTAWTANVLVGFSVALAMVIVAKPAALFFQDPRIEHVVYSFSALSLAKGFENIGVVNFRKNLVFRGDFLYFVVPKLFSVLTGITAAVILRSYWALVIGMIATQVVTLLYSHFSQPFRPRLSLEKFSELFTFTKWILIGKILRYVIYSGMEIIIGRLRGPEAVGFYQISTEVSYLPSTEIAAPVNRALFPSFSTIAADSDRLKSAFARVVAVAALICLPASFGIMAISDSLVSVVFGEQWLAAAPILAVLAIVGLLDAANGLVEPVLMARGAVRSLTYVLAAHTAMLVPLAIVLVHFWGAIGAAYAMLMSGFVALPMYLHAARRQIGIRAGELARSLWRPFVAALLMALIVKELEKTLVAPGGATVVTLLGLVAVGAIVYFGLLGLLWAVSGRPPFPELMLVETMQGYLKSRRTS